MAAYDDPNFVKALKLLHSPAPDSADQIMRMLEDVIEQKYGGSKALNQKLSSLLEDTALLEIPKARGSRGPSPVFLSTDKSSRSCTPPSDPVSLRTSPDRDDGDLALEIFEDDLFCTVCKGIRVTVENRLLECNECHSLYHQECHKPPVEDDVNDPRLIWCCGDCTRKLQEKSNAEKKKSSSSSHSEPPPKKHKSDSEKSEKSSSYKKSDKEKSSQSKSHSSSSSSSSSKSSSGSSKSESRGSKYSGPSLNFSKQPGSPNGKGGSAPAPANIMAADRRLQNMKKKAAAKMQEKRSNPK